MTEDKTVDRLREATAVAENMHPVTMRIYLVDGGVTVCGHLHNFHQDRTVLWEVLQTSMLNPLVLACEEVKSLLVEVSARGG